VGIDHELQLVGALFLAALNRGRPAIAEIPGLHQCDDLLAYGVQNDVHLFDSFVVNGPINHFPKKFT
jgi:hypothetical protein